METEGTSDILYVGFNQDTSWFACGTENGFKIYNTDPYKNTFNREFDGGISVVTMLFRWNILALVCGGSKPKYSTDRVIMWDDDKGKWMGELKFKTAVKAVKMNKETIAVVLQDRIYVYEFKSLKIKEAIETYDNPNGLWCLSAKKDTNVLVCPDKEKGKIRIVINESFNTVEAHQGTIAWLSISFDGSLVATASEKGTLVRIIHILSIEINLNNFINLTRTNLD